MNYFATLSASALILFSSLSSGKTLESLTFCGDGEGWPPYHYTKNDQVIGYDIDVVNKIFSGSSTKVSAELPPWKRCLAETDKGFKYQVALSSSYKDDRAKTFIYTKPYYELNGYYFYSKAAHPNGLTLSSAADLQKYQVCGLAGYNYDSFGIKTKNVSTSTKNFETLVKKTLDNRCDIFLARNEIIAGFKVIGNDLLTDKIAGSPAHWMEGEKFYMLVSRNVDNSQAIVDALNQGIDQLKESGELNKLIDHYLQ